MTRVERRIKLYNLPIRWKLFLWYSIVILSCVLIMASVAYRTANRHIMDSFREIARNEVDARGADISGQLALVERLSGVLVMDYALTKEMTGNIDEKIDVYNLLQTTAPKLQSIYQYNSEIYYISFYLDDPIFENLGGPIGWTGDVEEEAWYIAHLEARDVLYFCGDTRSPVDPYKTATRAVSLIRPLYNWTTLHSAGVVKLDIRSAYIENALDNRLFDGAISWIENASGDILFLSGADGWDASAIRVLRDSAENSIAVSETGGRYLVNECAIEAASWMMFDAVPLTHIELKQRPATAGILQVAAVCLLFLLMVSFVIANGFARRLKRISGKVSLLAQGNLDVRVEDRSADEFGKLGAAFDKMGIQLAALIDDNNQSNEQLRKAELTALQAQINPHFLYNTLSLISYMADDIDAHEISDVTQQLTRFFRLSLNRGEDMLTVEEEIGHVRAYLEIQTCRFKGKLAYAIDADPDALRCRMIKLVLQPFVENALVHGMAGLERPLNVCILVKREGGGVRFLIEDDGCGPSDEAMAKLNGAAVTSGGYGIQNVRTRIEMRYGECGSVTLERRETGGARAVVIIKAEEM